MHAEIAAFARSYSLPPRALTELHALVVRLTQPPSRATCFSLDRASLARAVGVSRAAVTMGLRKLAAT